MSLKLSRMLLQSLIFLLIISSLFPAYATLPVSDISTHWAKAEITLANEQGWAFIQNGKFNPNKSATREEVVWMLVGACKASKYEGFDINKKADLSKFKDKPSDWAADRMAIAIAHGYIQGYPDNTIRAKNPITRAEFAVLLSRLVKDYKFAGFLPFRDYIPTWALDGIKTAYGTGIIKGYTDNSFKAEANVTKAEALVMIMRWKEPDNLAVNKLHPVPDNALKEIKQLAKDPEIAEHTDFFEQSIVYYRKPLSDNWIMDLRLDCAAPEDSRDNYHNLVIEDIENKAILPAAKKVLAVYYPQSFEAAFLKVEEVIDSKDNILGLSFDGRTFDCYITSNNACIILIGKDIQK